MKKIGQELDLFFPKNQKTRPPKIQFFQRVNFSTKKIGDTIHSDTLVFIEISRRIIQNVPIFTLEDFNTSKRTTW